MNSNFFSVTLFQIKAVNSKSRSRYHWVCDSMPSTVIVKFEHNHLSLNAEALSLRKSDSAVRQQFENYFKTAAAAAELHSNQLDLDADLECSAVITRADAAVNPKRSTISYWYSQWREDMEKECGMCWRAKWLHVDAGACVAMLRNRSQLLF